MSKDAAKETEAAPVKKGGKKKLILMVVGGLVLAGGGVAGGMFAAGMGLGGAHANEPKADPDAPKLTVRDGRKANPADAFKVVGSFQPDPRLYKPSYYTMTDAFTSNLRDTDGIVQLSLAVSTFYGQQVTDAIKDNEQPVRSAALEVLANQDAFTLGTPEGKEALRGKLRDAVNHTLVEKTGYGGVDSVYFTNFIIQ